MINTKVGLEFEEHPMVTPLTIADDRSGGQGLKTYSIAPATDRSVQEVRRRTRMFICRGCSRCRERQKLLDTAEQTC
jgi:hypothetical protein